MPRISPLEAPFEPPIEELLAKWMPPGTDGLEPLALFRLLVVHEDLAGRMRPLGAGLLGHSTIGVRPRELLIARTTARSGASYEWGVHVTAFGRPAAGLDDDQVRSTAIGSPDDEVWSEFERSVLRLADELHENSSVSDETLSSLRERWSDAQILEAVICCGWYRLLSQLINVAALEPEPWAEAMPS